MNKINITTKDQVRAVANEVLGKRIVKMLKLSVYPDKNCTGITSVTGDYSVEETIIPLKSGQVKAKNFTRDIVSVQFYDKGEDTSAKENALVYSFCAINYSAKGVDIMPYVGGKFKSLSDGTLRNLKEAVSMGSSLYVMGPISASEGRKAAATLYKVDNKSEDLASYIDDRSYGAFSIQYGKEMERVALQKISTRFGQWKTGMGLMSPSSAPTALFVGKWELEGFGFADGHGFENMNDLVHQLSMATEKYSFCTSAVEGLMVQNRRYSMWKLESLVVSPGFIQEKIIHDAKEGKENILWLKRDASNQAIYNSLFDGMMEGTVVILYSDESDKGNLKAVSCYTDLNGAKAPHDITCNTGANIMKIDKPKSKNIVNLNTQFLESAAYADFDKTAEFVRDLIEKEIKEESDAVKRTDTSVCSIRDMKTSYMPAIAKAIAPRYSLANDRLYSEIAEDTFKGLSKRVRHLSLPVEGKNRLLTCDPAAFFGVKVLESDECLVQGKASGVKVVVMRNPKITPGEFVIFKTVSVQDYIRRLQSSGLSSRVIALLTRHAGRLTKSAIVIPAFSDILDLLGGADFDGDAAAVIEEKSIVSIFEKIKPMAIRVHNAYASVASSKVRFDVLSFAKAFHDLINNGNKSIGEVTYMANLLLSLLGQIRKGKQEDALYFFKQVLEAKGGDGEYASLETTPANVANGDAATVSFDIMFDVITRARYMALTDENMAAVLKDLVTCHMMLQMETIDAPKKGTKVPVAFENLLKKMTQASKTNLFVSPGLIDRRTKEEKEKSSEQGGVIFSIEDRSGFAAGRVMKTKSGKYVVQDDLHEIRLAGARELFKEAQKIRTFVPENYEEYERFFRFSKEEFKGELTDNMVRMKFMSNTVFAAEMGKEEQQIAMEALANTARAITPGLSAVERGRLAEYVSMPKAGVNNGHSPFALKVMHKEYLNMLLEEFAEDNYYGEEALVHTGLEDEDGNIPTFEAEFVAGLYIDGEKTVSVRTPIDGLWRVKEINGKVFVVRQIEAPKAVYEASRGIFARISYREKINQEALLSSGEFITIGEDYTVRCGKQIVGSIFPRERLEVYKGLKGSVENFFVTEERKPSGEKNRLIGMVILPEGEIFEETEMFEEDYDDMDSLEELMEEYDVEGLFV